MKKVVLLIISLHLLINLSACSDSETLGKVDGRKITKEEFNLYLKHKRIPEQDQRKVQIAFDQYLEREAMAAAIKNADYLDNKIIEVELREFEKQLLISRYFERYLKEEVTDDNVRNYYTSHMNEFESNKIEVAHILFRASKSASEEERKAILTTAHEAYSKLQRGEKFEVIAAQYSEDKISAKNGGSLGWINEGAVDKDFSAKVFSMKAGEVSEPFASSFGFHIAKVMSEPQVIKKPLEAVMGDIRYRLKNKNKQQEIERLLSSVKVKNYMENNEQISAK